MIVKDVMKLNKTDREVSCPSGGFKSIRILIEKENMGYTVTRTTVYPTKEYQRWHYKNHFESCYCISGDATLKEEKTGKTHHVKPGMFYALDKNDPHLFKAKKRTILICVFNPALKGKELHQKDGSYSLEDGK